jgi:hypothetical protein
VRFKVADPASRQVHDGMLPGHAEREVWLDRLSLGSLRRSTPRVSKRRESRALSADTGRVMDGGVLREARRLLASVELALPPMPEESEADDTWETWADLQETQAILAGFVSQLAGGTVRDEEGFIAVARSNLENERVRALVGNRIVDFASLLDLVEGQLIAAGTTDP